MEQDNNKMITLENCSIEEKSVSLQTKYIVTKLNET